MKDYHVAVAVNGTAQERHDAREIVKAALIGMGATKPRFWGDATYAEGVYTARDQMAKN